MTLDQGLDLDAEVAPSHDSMDGSTGPHRSVGLSLAALALGGFAIGTTEFATMGILPLVASDLHSTIPEAGHLISSYALGVVVGAPLAAVAAARMERRKLLLLLMAAFTLGNLVSAIAGSFPMLLLARFASGLPHGAYFGIAAVVAASLVPPDRKARAVARVMLGLTVANILGVPLSTFLGQSLGWRSTYVTVTVIGALTLVALLYAVPRIKVHQDASPRQELRALQQSQVWLTLLIGAIGFGGFFAVYSYISPTMTTVSGLPVSAVPLVLAAFGVGMTIGTLVGGRLADWSLDRAIAIGLALTTVVLVSFALTAHIAVLAVLLVFLLGATGSLMTPALQTRLMDVAPEGPSLAATMNHSALNLANAMGAFLGGLVIAAGYGYTAPALVGAVLGMAGLGVLAVAVLVGRRQRISAA
jgi:DHA1 family inner membrane transport protein